MDSVLGTANPAKDRPEPEKPKPRPTSGMDARNLGSEDGNLVLTPQKATALALAVVLLLILSFVAGYLIASK